jgi:hypothetical protein
MKPSAEMTHIPSMFSPFGLIKVSTRSIIEVVDDVPRVESQSVDAPPFELSHPG